MKFLLDTNILIPLEPTQISEFEDKTILASELVRVIGESGHKVCIHEAAFVDLKKDKDNRRREGRKILLAKYQEVKIVSHAFSEVTEILGATIVESNDWVDHHHLSSLLCDAADILVTQDEKLAKKASKLGLADRVFTFQEAINYLKPFLFDESFVPPPAVKKIRTYEIDFNNTFFDSFRADYPGFGVWAKKCRQDSRFAWVIYRESGQELAGICIIKHETVKDLFPIIPNCSKLLKICSFKVANECVGLGYGELLLKTVFEYANSNNFSHCYISVLGRYQLLINLLQNFGFDFHASNPRLGDDFYFKNFVPTEFDENIYEPLEFSIKFGPNVWSQKTPAVYIIPIQPKYHRILFSDCESQVEVWEGENPAGNNIRKAYLSKSAIKALPIGSLILFYSSRSRKSITTIGIIERTIRSDDPDRIARTVSKRTVYTYNQIKEQCRLGEILAILFRQVTRLNRPITLSELVERGFVKASPQTIQSISNKVLECVQH